MTPLPVKLPAGNVTLEIVTLEFPVFFRVVVNALLLFTFTLPNAKLLGVAVKVAVADVPVPVNDIASGEFGALLTSETDPLALPAVVGAKTTLNDVLPPAGIVLGSERPFVLKPVPVTLA